MDDRRPKSDEPSESTVDPSSVDRGSVDPGADSVDPKAESTDPRSKTPPERRRRGNRHHAYRRKNRSARQGGRDQTGAQSRPAPTSAEMRAARASGRTPGISTAAEPSAVPLCTDDEAAGMPPSADVLQQEVDRAEQGRGMQGLTAEEAMTARPRHPEESSHGFGRAVTIGAGVVILVVLALLLL